MSRLEQLKKLVADAGQDPLPHYALGLEYTNLERWQEALAAFEAALKVDGRYAAGYYQKARAQLKLGQPEAARAALRTGLEVADATRDARTVAETRKLLDTIG